MGYSAIISNNKSVLTSIIAANLNKTEVSVRVNGEEKGVIPYIVKDGYLGFHFLDPPKEINLLTIQVNEEPMEFVGNEKISSNLILYVHHNSKSTDPVGPSYHNTKQYKDSLKSTIKGQLPFNYLEEGKSIVRNIIRLAGEPIKYEFPDEASVEVKRYWDYLFKRDIDPITGGYDKGHICGLESGGIHVLRYLFSDKRTVIHRLEEPPSFIMINGGLTENPVFESFEDGYFLELTDNSKWHKISLYDTMRSPIPMVYHISERVI